MHVIADAAAGGVDAARERAATYVLGMQSMLRVLALARGAASVQGLQAGGDLGTAALPADT